MANEQSGPDVPVDHSRFRRVERLAITQRRTLQLATVEPDPPRGVRLIGTTAQWEEPTETRNVTHYNIYAPDENTIERQVPAGSLKATAITGITNGRIFVSAYNNFTELESRTVMAKDELVPEVPGSGGDGTEFIPVTGYSFTATQVADITESGTQIFRLEGEAKFTGAPPEEYGGVRIIAKVNTRGWVWVADLTKDQTNWVSSPLPKQEATQTWVIYALLRDTAGNSNEVADPGATPKVTVVVNQEAAGSLDLGRSGTGTYNFGHFQIISGVFSLKEIPGDLIVGNIATTGSITGGSYYVGATSGKDLTSFFLTDITITSSTLNYKDHAGTNQTMTVVTFISKANASHTWTKGILTF